MTTLASCSQQPIEGREVVAAQVPEGLARVVEVAGEEGVEAAAVEAAVEAVDPAEAVAFREAGVVNGSPRRPCSWEWPSPATSRPL